MFFDKHFRKDRYDCIINEQEKHKNINEFRTYVMHRYYRYPIAAANFLKVGGYKKDFAQITKSDDQKEESNQEDEE